MYTEVYPLVIRRGFASHELCILIMFEPYSNRNIPILIGEHDADMISMEKDGKVALRPQTHQLIESIMDSFLLELKEVTIDRWENGMFYATLHISDGINTRHIDCRASDAVVLAIREEVAILMEQKVIEAASYPSENDAKLSSIDEEVNEQPSLESLESLLKEYEIAEEYEKAAEILEKIKALKGQ